MNSAISASVHSVKAGARLLPLEACSADFSGTACTLYLMTSRSAASMLRTPLLIARNSTFQCHRRRSSP
jgi:hypothetical protein